MNLTQEGNLEKWLVKSDNAGALLKGIGAYEDMRAGSMLLVLTASRKEIAAGEVIPIIDGKFEFERFVLYNAPSLTKLVSVVSVLLFEEQKWIFAIVLFDLLFVVVLLLFVYTNRLPV